MKLFIFLLILTAFMQTSFIPLNLCLILIICRSFVVEEQGNLVAGFISGILLSILSSQNLGFWPLIFILNIKSIHLVKKLPVISNTWLILPLALALILLTSFIQGLFFNQTVDFRKLIWETGLSLPVYAFFRFWEERFIIKNEIKLKMRA